MLFVRVIIIYVAPKITSPVGCISFVKSNNNRKAWRGFPLDDRMGIFLNQTGEQKEEKCVETDTFLCGC